MIALLAVLACGPAEAEDAPAADVVIVVEDSDATTDDAWLDGLTLEERALVTLTGIAVDAAVDRLTEDGRIRGTGIPWVPWGRDALKVVFGIIAFLVMYRTRRPVVDNDAIVSGVVARMAQPAASTTADADADADAVATLEAALAKSERERYSVVQQFAEAQKEFERVRQPLPGLEDPTARRATVEQTGRNLTRPQRG